MQLYHFVLLAWPQAAVVVNAYQPSSTPGPRQSGGQSSSRPKNAFLRWLAELSLEDYQWRSGIFKATQAERMVETSVARLTNTTALYLRPMDAPRQGILGAWENSTVHWLLQVIDEEAQRARTIVASAGELVRPIEMDGSSRGPLGYLELRVVEFFKTIRAAEQERIQTKTLRPKDLSSGGGPLGELERKVVNWFRELQDSELLRGQLIRQRHGDLVRPMDVPGPLGEIELRVVDIIRAEQSRAKERRETKSIVRPMNAKIMGPLGEAELTAFETIRMLSDEELERARNIKLYLEERRPMDASKDSILGMAEAIVVGLLRAPRMIYSIAQRVQELLQSEPLSSFPGNSNDGTTRLSSTRLGDTNKNVPSSDNSDESSSRSSPDSTTR